MTTQVFQALEQMDVNGDGKVTLEEMTNYFAVAKSLFPTTAQFIEVRAPCLITPSTFHLPPSTPPPLYSPPIHLNPDRSWTTWPLRPTPRRRSEI